MTPSPAINMHARNSTCMITHSINRTKKFVTKKYKAQLESNLIHIMALSIPTISTTVLITSLLLLLLLLGGSTASDANPTSRHGGGSGRTTPNQLPATDVDLLEFPLNLEYLEAEFFSWGALGHGLDKYAPALAMGGPPPVGVKKAKLTPFIKDIITQFAFQEFGHLRAIKKTVPGFPRPLLDLSAPSFARVMNMAVGKVLVPPFDPYANDINYLLACYLIPYMGLTGYVGSNPKLVSPISKALVAGLLGVESGQDAVIRTLLYERAIMKVVPYDLTVAEFTDKISNLRNKLGKAGLKDEGLIVIPALGAEGEISGNVLAGNQDSLSYSRTPPEILRVVYGTGREELPGGFYPEGANGRIARSFLKPDQ